MKKTIRLRSFLALAGSAALLASQSANAATYYWDTDGTTAGLGDTAGTWGAATIPGWGSMNGASSRIVILGTQATANTTILAADTVYFGTVNLALGSTASTIVVGTGVTAGNTVFGAGQGAQGVTLSGGGAITLASGAAAPIIASNNTGNNTIGVVLAGSTGLAVYGPGSLLLTGTNTFTGGTRGLIVRNGGTLQVGNGTSGSLTSQDLTFKIGGGVFNVRAADTGSTQAMGALLFSSENIGEGTVQSTYGTSGNAELTFGSLGARGAGATGNFVVTDGSNGTTNKIVLTGAATGFLDKGLFFGGSSYAAYDATGYVRALNYATTGGDTDTVDADTITASKHVQLTTSPAARAGDTLFSLNLSGGGVDYTMNADSLTVPAILKTGGGALSTISGGTSLTTLSDAELVIRTATSSDLLEISTGITGFTGGLNKAGAGTLTLSGSNGYTGATRINAGTLVLSGGSAITDTQTVALANAAGTTLQLNSSETILSVTEGGVTGGTVNVQGNTLTLSSTASYSYGGIFTGTSSGGVIKQGVGTLTLGNKNTFTGTTTLEGGAIEYTYGNDGTGPLIALSSGGDFNMAGGTTLRFNPTANFLLGTFGSQLQAANGGSPAYPYGWTFANNINITGDGSTASIRVGGNENSVRFTGNVTGGTSGTQTLAIFAGGIAVGNGDRQPNVFSGTIANGSGGTLGVNVDFAGASGGAQNVFVSLSGQNTFTGPIVVTNSKGLTGVGAGGGYLGIGGEIHSSGPTFIPGTGYLGVGGNYTNTIALAAGTKLTYLSSANQTLGGEVSGNGALIKLGVGTLTLSVANTYTGTTTVSAGTLLVNNTTGSGSGTGNVSVTAGTLGGNGSISGTVTIGNSTGSADSILAPGTSIGAIATGNLTFNSDGRYAVELNGTLVTTDVTNVTGTVSINTTASLAVSLTTGSLAAGQKYFIVVNDVTDVVGGTAGIFAGMAQDAVVGNFGGTDLKISYTGNSATSAISGGNDIVLYTDGSGTPYTTWATGSEPFDGDANGDSVDDGLAWFLGASGPGVSALGKLPVVSTPTDYLQLDFTRENPYAPAKLYLEYGNDLSGWTKLEIPAGTGIIGGDIEVTITAGPPDAIKIKIPTATHAVAGKLFARLSATEN